MTARIILGETPASGVLYLVRGDGAQLALEVDQDWTGVTVTLGWGGRGDGEATILDPATSITVDAGESLVTWTLTEAESDARQVFSHFRIEANGKTVVSGPVFVTDGWVGGTGADGQTIGRVISGPAGTSDPQDIADAVEDYLTANPPSGVTDHGALTGLGDDDHTQYALADGSRGSFAPPLGSDDNYVTDAEKTKLENLSGTNTGDQDLSGLVPTSRTVNGKPLSANITLSAADVGASTFSGAYGDLTDKPTLGDSAAKNTGTTAGTVAAGDDSRITGAIPSGLVDAKGDLIVGTADNTVTRLPASTDGHVLTLDSAESAGVKWAAPSGGGSSYELHGTGMPNGVVTANPGTYYTDEAGTNGAWRWLKKTGTGNTGWEVATGTTRRQMVSTISADFTANDILLARYGDVVTLACENVAAVATGGAALLMAIPLGFRTVAGFNHTWAPPGAGSNLVAYVVSNNIYWPRGTTTNTQLAVSWITADPWPTTLPGTPA